ncbi:enoyl-CoA hydratase/isomerase family protein [Altererythrobacter sp. KTW20L]|uniref:enoyl-CoA hydratase/isomerase family protein n=1 Tax=Altererythrobacter sp. KTW20L TaxID=2942210 RepID=UPI0020BF1A41|nr:enoyl-CoA hydratase/isomerase family protein [Altererythrobacter sp. KTW20L]MCL6250428.1 enoyl-CoA hydratase/isomerase family protein [Altererythrobacter sp. KTW20L]
MTNEILSSRQGALATITLNRPRALHSLSHGMCEAMSVALLEWRSDPAVEAVVIDHAGERGFCAGGDVVSARRSVLEDGCVAARAFFMAEYRLNHLLYTYPKPVIAFMDGVTMGGGVGIALPCTYRVATENTLLAMPEGAIGLFPDVGAGLYLSRLPGRLGQFLALTAARLDGAECLWAGLATHYLKAEDLAEAKEAIAREPLAAGDILKDLSSPPPPARLERNAERIDGLFASDSLEGIIAALSADPSDWAAKELKAVTAKCPTSAKVALRQLAAKPTDFAAEMALEYALAARMIARPDFAEGVRAVLVDKDNAPRWQPAAPEDVSDAMLDDIFAPQPPAEGWTPFP